MDLSVRLKWLANRRDWIPRCVRHSWLNEKVRLCLSPVHLRPFLLSFLCGCSSSCFQFSLSNYGNIFFILIRVNKRTHNRYCTLELSGRREFTMLLLLSLMLWFGKKKKTVIFGFLEKHSKVSSKGDCQSGNMFLSQEEQLCKKFVSFPYAFHGITELVRSLREGNIYMHTWKEIKIQLHILITQGDYSRPAVKAK